MPSRSMRSLIGPRLSRVGRVMAPKPTLTAASRYYWNPGVNTSSALAKGGGRPRPVGVQNYYNAGVQMAYGNTGAAKAELGDLFNDIMGAVVPGWDQRPAALKKIVVRPDPAKLIAAAQKIAPNAASQIVGAANANGLNVLVNTPVGQMPLSQAMAQGLYSNASTLTTVSSAFAAVPTWAWMAGGGGLLLLLVAMKR